MIIHLEMMLFSTYQCLNGKLDILNKFSFPLMTSFEKYLFTHYLFMIHCSFSCLFVFFFNDFILK